MTFFSAVIRVEPQPKQAARVYMRGGRFTACIPAKTRKNMKQISAQLEQDIARAKETEGCFPLTGPLRVDVSFVRTPPQSRPKGREYPDVRPDLDNYQKLLWDACTQAGLFVDDSQLVDVRARKQYAKQDTPAGIYLHVRSMKDSREVGIYG